MATTDYGSDFSLVTDLDSNLSTVSGPMVVVQAIVRRLQTPRGKLFYDSSYGHDLRQYINGNTPKSQIRQAVVRECLKDERVDRATAQVTLTGDTMSVVIRLTLVEGEVFTLTIGVDALTVELITFDQAA